MILKTLGSGSQGNCYILQNSQEALVIEAGVKPDKVKKALNYSINNRFIVSHQHGDHNKYEKAYKAFCRGRESQSKFRIIDFDVVHDSANKGYIIYHPDMGYLMYATDCMFLPKNISGLNHLLIEANYDEDILQDNVSKGFVAGWLADRIRSNHLSIQRLEHWLNLIDKSQLITITLCHLSDSNSYAEEFKKRVASIVGCEVRVAENQLATELSL